MALAAKALAPAGRLHMPTPPDSRAEERVWYPDAPPVDTADQGKRHGLTIEQFSQLDLDLRVWAAWVKNGRKPLDVWASGATAIAQLDAKVRHGPPVGGYGPGVAAEPPEEHRAEMVDRVVAGMIERWRLMLERRYIKGWTNARIAAVGVLSERSVRTYWKLLYRDLFIRLYADPGYEATRAARQGRRP